MNSRNCFDNMLTSEVLEREMNIGCLIWYDFRPKSRILCVELKKEIIDFLTDAGHEVVETSSQSLLRMDVDSGLSGGFDYVVLIEVLEKVEYPVALLSAIKRLLNRQGILLLGTDNRLGLRYFCGESEKFAGEPFIGLENYFGREHSSFDTLGGRCLTKAEVLRFLNESGFINNRYYSLLPDLNRTQLVYAQDYLPKESLGTRYIPLYEHPEQVVIDEKRVYDSLIDNGLFHEMANSYLFECSKEKLPETDICHVTLSIDRGREQALATIIRKGIVEKKALYVDGRGKVEGLSEQDKYLRAHGIEVVESSYQDGVYRMPYVDAPIASVYLQDLLLKDKDLFIQRMDEFWDLILSSSMVVEETELGPILERGYIDLVPLNCFWMGNHYLVYDQEFYENNYPARVMMLRTLIIIYDGDATRQAILPWQFFLKRYHILEVLDELLKLERKFIVGLRHLDIMEEFHKEHQITPQEIWENRKNIGAHRKEIVMIEKLKEVNSQLEQRGESLEQQLNDIKASYRGAIKRLCELFKEHCFEGMNEKKIYVFGSGKFADKFMAFYKTDYEIVGVVDNDSEKWGIEWEGMTISSPEIMRNVIGPFKVIVCVKRCEEIILQLLSMGIKDIGVYDGNYFYPGRQLIFTSNENNLTKKYRVGYVSGVFDLYHIGHINMFRRAKEQCEYLIAAVTSDEYVINHKNREPFIPFEERMQVVGSCKYVDEVVGVPYKYAGTVEAFQKYHFDCQFCGSDYENDPWWLKQKAWLEQYGSTIEFLSYTMQTSSTKIKELIGRRLL